MTVDQVRGALTAVPFRPFVIHMADGRTFRVRHQDFLLLSPGGRTALAFETEEAFSILDMLLMTEVQYEAPVKTVERAS